MIVQGLSDNAQARAYKGLHVHIHYYHLRRAVRTHPIPEPFPRHILLTKMYDHE